MIVIPMAGLSRRFQLAGYTQPKYMLELDGVTAFDHAVVSFAAYFQTLPFLFVARETGGVSDFVQARAAALGVRDPRIAVLAEETAGQAETVLLGLDSAKIAAETPLTIFNIDTFRPNFRLPPPDRLAALAGYLEVFRGSGSNWSYVEPSDVGQRLVRRTAEKQPISDLCCTGIYHFARADLFIGALLRERQSPQAAELYVAPLYNYLIAQGLEVGYEIVAPADVVFCGTPAEYQGLRAASWRAPSNCSNIRV